MNLVRHVATNIADRQLIEITQRGKVVAARKRKELAYPDFAVENWRPVLLGADLAVIHTLRDESRGERVLTKRLSRAYTA